MLKTNTRKARQNIRNYIINHSDFTNYEKETPTEFPALAVELLETFRDEFFEYSRNYYHNNEYNAFIDWCSGLPSVIDTCYYYNRSAVDDLAAILEETETEKAKYSESESEALLTWLIYRELTAAERAKK